MKTVINSKNAPAAIGPYSQGIAAAGETIYVSGQLPIDPDAGKITAGDIAGQTEQSLKNVGNILREAGADFGDVVQATVYLADISEFAAMNTVYARYFTENYPARAAFQVAALPMGSKVEIAVTAVI